MHRSWIPVIAMVLFATLNPPQTAADELGAKGRIDPGVTKSTGAGLSSESTDDLLDDLRYLTSEELKGRSSIDPTIQLAAQHIAARFAEIGLETKLFDGGPFQSVDIPVGPRIGNSDQNRLAVSSESESASELGTSPYELTQDFNPMAIGAGEGDVESSLAWVGYGIRAEEYGYDDYASVDVEGKVVMMLRKEPGPANPDSPFDGVKNTRHAFFQTKVATAIDAGAVAVILVNDLESVERTVQELENEQATERKRIAKLRKTLASLPVGVVVIRQKLEDQLSRAEDSLLAFDAEIATARKGLLAIGQAGEQPQRGSLEETDDATGKRISRPPVPVISVSREIADQWIRAANPTMNRSEEASDQDPPTTTLGALTQKIDSEFQPQSFLMPGVTVRIQVAIQAAITQSPNVLGVLPGAGQLADETIVVGAHYDHVGMGGFASLAPGTIAIHNGADDNASGTAIMLQVAEHMVASLAQFDDRRRVVFIAFTGEERGLLGSKHYVKQPRFPITGTAAMINMDMVGRLKDNELTVYGTESASVMNGILDQANVKAGFKLERIGSGYGPSDHASFYEAGVPVLFFFTGLHSDYHRPSDDFEKLNLDGMRRITDMVCQVSERLATMPERPEYTKTAANVQIRRQLTVFMGVKLSQQPGEVVFSSILATGPAEAAGLLAGDRLVSMGGKPVKQIDKIFEQLRRYAPGDMLPVDIKRGDEVLRFQVKLRAR